MYHNFVELALLPEKKKNPMSKDYIFLRLYQSKTLEDPNELNTKLKLELVFKVIRLLSNIVKFTASI